MNQPGNRTPKEGPDEGTVPLPRPFKQKIKDGLVALSLANLCFIKVAFDLLSDKDRYFNKLPVTTPVLLALVANLFGFTLLIWLVMQILRRFSNRLLHLGIHLMFFALLLLPLDFIRLQFFNISDYELAVFLKQPVMLFCELVVLATIFWQHRLIARILAVFVSILSPLAIFLLVKIALVCLGVTPLINCQTETPPPPLSPVHAGQPRVIWIIFDELDYRLTFEQTPAGFQFPEFDRLQQESLAATDAMAPADMTLMSMPSLILGQRLSAVSAENSCDLTITFAVTGATTTWIGQPSVFSGARALGFNTAVVGWYIPYDRMLQGTLNFCEWYPYPPYNPARAETFAGEVWQQIDSLTETLHIRKLFVTIHRDSLRASLSVVTNSVYGLALLHLPAPHRPGVYLPDQDKFSATAMAHMSKVTAYFDNLALADRELGKLRHAMENQGQWDKTWVILSADHSWRESSRYDGRRDYRVPFLVKPPGKNGPMACPQPFNTVLTHDLILAILRRELTNQQDAAHWLDAHATQSATITGGGHRD